MRAEMLPRSSEFVPHDSIVHPGDVVQISPLSTAGMVYGPQMVIIESTGDRWIDGYWVEVDPSGKGGRRNGIRLRFGDFMRVGRAIWVLPHAKSQ